MILIGTSGSTRCDWQLIQDGETIRSFKSKGINPYFHSEDTIAETVSSIPEITEFLPDIKVVYMYNAGCASKALQIVVQKAFSRVFRDAHLYVNHDIVAAAFATYDGLPSITAILGTGSNSCYFDGDFVRQEILALDYILGDEGSGSYYGKKLLNQYLYKKLPSHLEQAFREKYPITEFEILENVYMKPYANVYLASYIKFINEYQNDPYFQEMIREGMSLFIDTYIKCYPEFKEVNTHFVGSVAYHFSDILKPVAEDKGIILGKILKRPIKQLVEYIVKKHNRS
jgi:N-acetylglucosamine kinase-like BadF-type ATPase